MSSDGRIQQMLADQRGASWQQNGVNQQQMSLVALQQHQQQQQQLQLQFPQHHQGSGGMQYISYPSVIGMSNQAYSFAPQNHNLNMGLQVGQMLGPNVTFQIPPGLLNPHQAAMFAQHAGAGQGVLPTMQIYADPMAEMAAAANQRTVPSTTGSSGAGLFQTPDIGTSNGGINTSHPPATQSRPIVPKRQSRKYHDYAKEPLSNAPDTESCSASGKDHSFPVKLHRILSDPEFQEYICWLPHGRSWKVSKQEEFEDKVIPLFFRHGKFASFMRQVNGWGFRRMPAGPEKNSYYHEMFLRGYSNLSVKMRRPVEKVRSTSDLKAHPNFNETKLFSDLRKEHQVVTDGATSPTDSGTGSDSNGNDSSGCGSRNNGFDTDTTTNAGGSRDGDQGGINMANLYGSGAGSGSDQGSSSDQDGHLYGGAGSVQGINLYGGSDQGSNMYGSGGSDQSSNHYDSENGSNEGGDPCGLDESPSNNENTGNSYDDTSSDNGGETTSDTSFASPSSNSRTARHAAALQSGAPTEKGFNQQQMLYRQLAREAQMNALEQKEGRPTTPGGSSRSGSDGSQRMQTL